MPENDPAPSGEPAPDAPERRVAGDIARRGLLAGPPLVLFCALGWGLDGLWSALLALGLVLMNFLAGAAIIGFCARISPAALMGGVLGGYFLRLGIITAVVVPIRHAGWFDALPFALVLLVLHIGLLIWELRHVAATLTHPGLHPGSGLFRTGAPRRPRRNRGDEPDSDAARITEATVSS
ncbi:MAG: ATP synthase subunit I [bacterium]|nr:ATP synthase subunit I [bacterium]